MTYTRLQRSALLLASVATLGLGLSSPGWAQAADSGSPASDSGSATQDETTSASTGGVEEIIVTARRREENLQRTPIAVTALTGDALAERGVSNLFDVSNFTPNMVSSSGTVSSNDANYFIRGIGQQDAFSNVEPGVGTYIDGVYLGRTAGAALDLVDVERVEVLRGPQGTLFGRNTIGGAINITTRKPRPEMGGRALLRVGERKRFDGLFSMDVPLSPAVLTKISALSKNSGGVERVIGPDPVKAGKERVLAGRAAVRLLPSDTFTIDATLDGTRRRGTAQCSRSLPVDPARPGIPAGAVNDFSTDRYTCFSSIQDLGAELDTWGANLTGELDLGSVTLKSITAYRELKQYAPVDNDGTTFNLYDLLINKKQDQFSQEVQLLGSSFDDRLNWLIGGYYFDENTQERQQLTFAALGPSVFRFRNFKPQTESYAGFTQATLRLTDELSFTAGARVTRDKKTMSVNMFDRVNGNIVPIVTTTVSKSWTSFSPKLSLEYQATPEVLFYASYSEGFRSGGFNARVRNASQLVSFDPETANVYEVGSKADLFDNKVRLNLAGWYNDYKDIQILALQGGFFSNRNAGDARLWGVEAELTARPVRAISFNAGVGYIDAKYKRLIPGTGLTTASRLPYLPDWTVTLGAQYEADLQSLGQLRLRADYSYRSKLNVFSPLQLEPGYSLVNLRAALELSESLEIAAYSTNTFNTRYATYRSVDNRGTPGSLGIGNEFLGRPREVGAELIVRF